MSFLEGWRAEVVSQDISKRGRPRREASRKPVAMKSERWEHFKKKVVFNSVTLTRSQEEGD